MTRFLVLLIVATMTTGLAGCRSKVVPGGAGGAGGARGGPTAVSGKVTIDGFPLVNGLVRLFESRGGAIFDTRQASQTDAYGTYRFAGLMPGVYRLELYKHADEAAPIVGYEATLGQLQFVVPETPTGQTLTKNFALGANRGALPATQPAPSRPANPPAPSRPATPTPSRSAQVAYTVVGARTPVQIETEVREALGAVAGIESGSIAVSPTQIRFRLGNGYDLLEAHATVTKLGFRITNTSSSRAN